MLRSTLSRVNHALKRASPAAQRTKTLHGRSLSAYKFSLPAFSRNIPYVFEASFGSIPNIRATFPSPATSNHKPFDTFYNFEHNVSN